MADRGALAGLVGPLLPSGVSFAATSLDGDEPDLWPEERGLVANAVIKRRREVAFGRDCARRALVALGLPPASILRDGGGAPVWPPGVVGSITHCDGAAAAAVARSTVVRGLGIDLECLARARDLDLIGTAATATERDRHAHMDHTLPVGALLFSAKESVYKCVYPIGRRFLDFVDVEIALEPRTGTFTVLYAGGFDVTGLRGRFATTDALVATTVALAGTAAP